MWKSWGFVEKLEGLERVGLVVKVVEVGRVEIDEDFNIITLATFTTTTTFITLIYPTLAAHFIMAASIIGLKLFNIDLPFGAFAKSSW